MQEVERLEHFSGLIDDGKMAGLDEATETTSPLSEETKFLSLQRDSSVPE